ncbi:MAG: Inner membrane ABC transporter permease protein YjfF [candidate division BRC1 bacterium ADurb.BinA364]|nr:MAG: Inner membrane ABC transporter permease protein YjfF [candidate division BRC1 bacterium ADurb.BinA364]
MKAPLHRKHLPFLATTLTFVLLYGAAGALYEGFFSTRVAASLLADNAFLGIAALGMTFVILSGGIDLSVGAALAFTTIFVATAIDSCGWHPLAAMAAAMALGAGFGAAMGWLIHAFAMPPFLVTLGGMFFARGMAFIVNMQSLGIGHEFHSRLQSLRAPLIPLHGWLSGMGLAMPRQAYLPATALIFLGLFACLFAVAHMTRFGRAVYALGGSEESALLMGVPVGRTKVVIYALNGFCSALAGVVATIYMGSGNPAMGVGLELDAIAAVVIGGTLLTGGSGYVAGTFVGVLIFGTIKMALIFDGRLNSWWLRIAIGALLLLFILLQKMVSKGSANRES